MPPTRTPGSVAMRRLQSELQEWLTNAPEGCRLISFEPLTVWIIEMDGPDESPSGLHPLYQGQTFKLRITFSPQYPLESPEVVFMPPSPIHPHIYTNGHICLDILYDSKDGGWSPALTVSKISLSLRSMLASNTELKRPVGDEAYCQHTRGKSPKASNWQFDDDSV